MTLTLPSSPTGVMLGRDTSEGVITVIILSLVGRMFGEFKCLAEKVWQMNRLAKRLLIVTTNLDGFSFANCI